jgi:dCTP deaminase
MILCRESILEAHAEGRIVIDPFDAELVGINSVDVRLGGEVFELVGSDMRDLYAPDDSRWRKVEPVTVAQLRALNPGFGGATLRDDDLCFVFRSGGFYLATTLEARSTVGRQGLTVALCAGLGDVGYTSRWALEVRVVDYGDVPVAVGTPVAQVVFHTATPTDAAYEGATRYQHAGAVKFLPKPLKIRRPGEG